MPTYQKDKDGPSNSRHMKASAMITQKSLDKDSSSVPLASIPPEERVRSLAGTATLDISTGVKAIQYVRSGKEMIRMAENYTEEGAVDSAYILYMRFLTLFIEKLKAHPGYSDIIEGDKKWIRKTCKDILPVAEKLKQKLLAQYQLEYDAYQKEKLKREEDEKRKRLEDESKRKQFSNSINSKGTSPIPSAPPLFEPTLAHPTIDTTYPISDLLASEESAVIRRPRDVVGPNIENNEKIQNGVSSYRHPSFDRSTKPSSHLMSPMGSDSLRTVVIPDDLIPRFVSLAATNTQKNTETCGILAGKNIRDQLVITHLIVPKQTGTADSCTTVNEEEIFTIIDRYSLIQLGWIHTHPSQTSFLSSVDLHTHLTYQLMMPESIAIVCAPSKHEWDIFTLTPLGMDILQQCTDSGFHPHPKLEDPYFVNASHAKLDPSRRITVEDLRLS